MLKTTIQNGSLHLLESWLIENYKYLNQQLISEIYQFLEEIQHQKSKTLMNIIEKTTNYFDIPVKQTFMYENWAPTDHFLSIDDEIIAKQLTLIDFKQYSLINTRELLQTAWSNPKYKYRAIHVRNFIERQNQLAFWITTMIVSASTLKARIDIWEKWIRIALVISLS